MIGAYEPLKFTIIRCHEWPMKSDSFRNSKFPPRLFISSHINHIILKHITIFVEWCSLFPDTVTKGGESCLSMYMKAMRKTGGSILNPKAVGPIKVQFLLELYEELPVKEVGEILSM